MTAFLWHFFLTPFDRNHFPKRFVHSTNQNQSHINLSEIEIVHLHTIQAKQLRLVQEHEIKRRAERKSKRDEVRKREKQTETQKRNKLFINLMRDLHLRPDKRIEKNAHISIRKYVEFW